MSYKVGLDEKGGEFVSDDRLLSKSEAAYRLGVSEKTIDRLVNAGKIAIERVGGRAKFTVEEIERYLQSSRGERPSHA